MSIEEGYLFSAGIGEEIVLLKGCGVGSVERRRLAGTAWERVCEMGWM